MNSRNEEKAPCDIGILLKSDVQHANDSISADSECLRGLIIRHLEDDPIDHWTLKMAVGVSLSLCNVQDRNRLTPRNHDEDGITTMAHAECKLLISIIRGRIGSMNLQQLIDLYRVLMTNSVFINHMHL